MKTARVRTRAFGGQDGSAHPSKIAADKAVEDSNHAHDARGSIRPRAGMARTGTLNNIVAHSAAGVLVCQPVSLGAAGLSLMPFNILSPASAPEWQDGPDYPPAWVESLFAGATADYQLTVTWTDPTSPYVVEIYVRRSGGTEGVVETKVAKGVQQLVIDGLTLGQTYTFEVYPIMSVGLHESRFTSQTVQATVDPVADACSQSGRNGLTDTFTLTWSDANDPDPSVYTVHNTNPALGTLASWGTPTRLWGGHYAVTVQYTGSKTTYGNTSFTFHVHKTTGTKTSNTATVTVAVVNTAPVAAGQSVTMADGTAGLYVDIVLTATDINDPPAANVTFAIVSAPAHGATAWQGSTVRVSACNYRRTLRYTPNASGYPDPFAGILTFTFRVYDGNLYSNTATVTVNVVKIKVLFTSANCSSNNGITGQNLYKQNIFWPPTAAPLVSNSSVKAGTRYLNPDYGIFRMYLRVVFPASFAALSPMAANQIYRTSAASSTGRTGATYKIFKSNTDLGTLAADDWGVGEDVLWHEYAGADGQTSTVEFAVTGLPGGGGVVCLWLRQADESAEPTDNTMSTAGMVNWQFEMWFEA